jgi:replicative superfamily II helicase
MIQLRDYQEEIVNGIRKSFANKNKRVILCAPTGSGKTVMFTYMVKSAIDKGGRVLIKYICQLWIDSKINKSKFNTRPHQKFACING